MRSTTYYQPTKIHFGEGQLKEVGDAASELGQSCLLVSRPSSGALEPAYMKVISCLEDTGVEVHKFDGVVPNPTVKSIDKGTEIAIEKGVDFIIGMGGGSSMDTAKAIAVGATHEGTAWDYRLFAQNVVSDQTLPIIAITTTSGTGSQVTPVSVLTNTQEKSKFAIVDQSLFPRVGIVDPTLMLTVPDHLTASTGFDVLAHAFESYIHRNASAYTDMLALKAIKLVAQYLPRALEDGGDEEARAQLAWADTLAGTCIANAGTTLPHGIGMAIGGYAPHVMHGEALACIYPEFMSYTWKASKERFASLARIFEPKLCDQPDEIAAGESRAALERFLKQIEMHSMLGELDVSQEVLSKIAEDAMKLPDYQVNPRVASLEDILEILMCSYD